MAKSKTKKLQPQSAPRRLDVPGETIYVSADVDLEDLDLDSLVTGDEDIEPKEQGIEEQGEEDEEASSARVFSRIYLKLEVDKETHEFDATLVSYKDARTQATKKNSGDRYFLYTFETSTEEAFRLALLVRRSVTPKNITFKSLLQEVVMFDYQVESKNAATFFRGLEIVEINKSVAIVELHLKQVHYNF